MGEAFWLRQTELYLSVNWLEQTGKTARADQIEGVRGHLQAKTIRLPSKGRFAVLNVGTVISKVAKEYPDKKLSVRHEPEPNDSSHSGIYGYTAEDDAIADLIALSCVFEVHPARG